MGKSEDIKKSLFFKFFFSLSEMFLKIAVPLKIAKYLKKELIKEFTF